MDKCHNMGVLILCLLQTLFTVVPLTLHIAGIRLLHKYSTYPPQQRLHLTQISIFEIMFLLINNNCLVYLELYRFLPLMAQHLQLFIKSSIAIPWCCVMIFLSLDRIAQIWLHVKYERYITTFRTRLFIGVAWTLGLTLFISMVVVMNTTNVDALGIVHFYVTQVFMGLVVVSIVPCYVYIAIKIHVNKRREVTPSSQTSTKKILFVPMWIVITYILTFLLPNILQVVYKHLSMEVTCYFYLFAQFLFISGCMADALVYLLLNKRMRRRFTTMIGVRKPNNFGGFRSETMVGRLWSRYNGETLAPSPSNSVMLVTTDLQQLPT